MRYEFKLLPEIGWAVVIAVAIAGATILLDFQPETIQDWERWAVAGAGALARSAAAALLVVLRPRAAAPAEEE